MRKDNSKQTPEECSYCGSAESDLTRLSPFALQAQSPLGKQQTHAWLCEICQVAVPSFATIDNPWKPPTNDELARMICSVGNTLLKQFREPKTLSVK